MIGIILATHGKLSDGLYDAANLIIGMMNNIEIINLNHGDCVNYLHVDLQAAIKKVDTGCGVVICTDLLSATPYNQSLVAKQELSEHSIEILSGVNLPMVIDLINHQLLSTPLDVAVKSAIKEATKGIFQAPMILEEITDDF